MTRRMVIITTATTTDTEKGRGNTSVEDGRNVCKGTFSLIYMLCYAAQHAHIISIIPYFIVLIF